MAKANPPVPAAKAISFKSFLKQFPATKFPIILGEDTHLVFSQKNDPLSEAVIVQHILPLEGDVMDDMTEFVACFSLPKKDDFYTIVYWKAALLDYQYKLVTYDKKGNLIDQKVIAGTFLNGEDITQSMATITEEYEIYMVSGQNQIEVLDYKADQSTANRFQLATNGKIVEM